MLPLSWRSVSAAWGFDFERYQATDLDELMEKKRPQTGVDLLSARPLKLSVALASYGEACNTAFLKRMMIVIGLPKEMVEGTTITRCIKARSANGKVVPLFIQDRVSEFLPKEIPLGSPLTLFVIHVFTAPDGPGLLVNEFLAANAGPGNTAR